MADFQNAASRGTHLAWPEWLNSQLGGESKRWGGRAHSCEAWFNPGKRAKDGKRLGVGTAVCWAMLRMSRRLQRPRRPSDGALWNAALEFPIEHLASVFHPNLKRLVNRKLRMLLSRAWRQPPGQIGSNKNHVIRFDKHARATTMFQKRHRQTRHARIDLARVGSARVGSARANALSPKGSWR